MPNRTGGKGKGKGQATAELGTVPNGLAKARTVLAGAPPVARPARSVGPQLVKSIVKWARMWT
jgi:hypothetical protein